MGDAAALGPGRAPQLLQRLHVQQKHRGPGESQRLPPAQREQVSEVPDRRQRPHTAPRQGLSLQRSTLGRRQGLALHSPESGNLFARVSGRAPATARAGLGSPSGGCCPARACLGRGISQERACPAASLTALRPPWGLCPRGAGPGSCWESALPLPDRELGLLSAEMQKLRGISSVPKFLRAGRREDRARLF